jgi:DNA-binding transcriptional MerR regulator
VRLIQRLTTELGLNLAGVETVLRLEDELEKMRTRMDRMEREARERIRTVERRYKREIVLYRGDGEPHPERKWTSTN